MYQYRGSRLSINIELSVYRSCSLGLVHLRSTMVYGQGCPRVLFYRIYVSPGRSNYPSKIVRLPPRVRGLVLRSIRLGTFLEENLLQKKKKIIFIVYYSPFFLYIPSFTFRGCQDWSQWLKRDRIYEMSFIERI